MRPALAALLLATAMSSLGACEAQKPAALEPTPAAPAAPAAPTLPAATAAAPAASAPVELEIKPENAEAVAKALEAEIDADKD